MDQGIKNGETMATTTALLRLNPEAYTVWNIRREVLSEMMSTMYV
jgi:hypothetical protein